MAGQQQEPASVIKPVYIRSTSIPAGDRALSVTELCRSVEKTCGQNSVDGAQFFGGLWRIYMTSDAARMDILLSGFDIRGIHVDPSDSNPFSIKAANGQEVPTTKLTISDIPLFVKDEEICTALDKLGIKLVGGLKLEYSRDEAGQLTRWKTGRRFTWIPVPAVPLKRNIRLGIYQAKFFHKEQWFGEKKMDKICNRCLLPGHYVRECTNPIRCKTCQGEGHKAGDPVCNLDTERGGDEVERGNEVQQVESVQQAVPAQPEARDATAVAPADIESTAGQGPGSGDSVPSTPKGSAGQGGSGSSTGGGVKRPHPPTSPGEYEVKKVVQESSESSDSMEDGSDGNT